MLVNYVMLNHCRIYLKGNVTFIRSSNALLKSINIVNGNMADGKANKYKFLNEESSIISDVTYADRLFQFLHECYLRGHCCDVIVQVDEKCFKTHRFVLAMISDYFRGYFRHDDMEEETIKLSMVNAKIFESILKFGYTGKVDLETKDLEELLIGADMLGVSSVKHICEFRLRRTVSKETCFRLLVLADTYSLPTLFKDVKWFWCNNFKCLSDSKEFLDLPPLTFLKVLADDELVLRKKVSDKKLMRSYEREKILYKYTLKYIDENLNTVDFDVLLNLLKAVKLFELTKEHLDKILKKYKKLMNIEEIQDLHTLAERHRSDKVKKGDLPSNWLTSRSPGIYHIIESPAYGSGRFIYECGSFDCNKIDPRTKITQIKLWTRTWDDRTVLGRIKITYEDGSVVDSGTRPHHSEVRSSHEYYVDLDPEEVITKVRLFSGWLIDRLVFITDKGRRFGPYGGDGGNPRTASAPVADSYLHGIRGNVTISQGEIAVMRLVWKWIDFD